MCPDSTNITPYQITFFIQGSAAEPYTVKFSKQGDMLVGTCTCQAASSGLICKHRLNLLAGKHEKIVSNNRSDVDILLSWLAVSPLKSLLEEMNRLQDTIDNSTKELKTVKRKLSQVLLGRKML